MGPTKVPTHHIPSALTQRVALLPVAFPLAAFPALACPYLRVIIITLESGKSMGFDVKYIRHSLSLTCVFVDSGADTLPSV